MTANFKCGHCGHLMGVSAEHLGQQVRCPTCQQVVLAPALTPPPPSPFELAPEQPAASPDGPSPPLEFPPGVPGQLAPPTGDVAPNSELRPAPVLTPVSFPDQPPPTHTNGESSSNLSSSPLVFADAPGGAAPSRAVGGSHDALEALASVGESPTAPRRREAAKINWLIPLVLMPLTIWALGATAAAIWGWLEVVKANRRPSLFDQLPDVEGDNPGVRKGKATSRLDWSPASASAELPAHLRVQLGGVLTVGDLEVRPLRVERGKVKVFNESNKELREQPYEALVLTLQLKNLAANYSFAPLDNYFDRRWEGAGPPPLTMLQAGKMLFWGGPHWRVEREWLAGPGRNNGDYDGLAPGATTEAIVATNGEDAEVGRVLFGVEPDGRPAGKPAYKGPLLWRVHVRRGLVSWRGKERAACAVVGVALSARDIARKGD